MPAELSGKNNIVVENKKISGNSQHANMRRMLSHGTLLFDAELDTLQQVLQSNPAISHSRAIASIPSSVTNISGYLSHPIDMDVFIAKLIGGVSKRFGELEQYQLTTTEWDAVHQLAEDKYRSWEWNIGRAPEFTVIHKIKLDAVDVGVHIRVKKAAIEEVKITGHPPVPAMTNRIHENLIGQRYDPSILGR